MLRPEDVTSVMVLDAAADRLQTTGWVKKEFGPPEGPNCGWGALCEAWRDLTGSCMNVDTFDRVLNPIGRELKSRTGSGITKWNDRPETTLEDVLLEFKQVRYVLAEKELGVTTPT